MENQNSGNENGKCFGATPISSTFGYVDAFQCLHCKIDIARKEDLIKKYGGGKKREDMQYGVFKDVVLHVNANSMLEIESTQIDCISCIKCGIDLGFQLITVKTPGNAAEVRKVEEENVEDGLVKKRKVTEGNEEKGNGKVDEVNLKIEKRFILFLNNLKLNRRGKSKEKRYDVKTGDI